MPKDPNVRWSRDELRGAGQFLFDLREQVLTTSPEFRHLCVALAVVDDVRVGNLIRPGSPDPDPARAHARQQLQKIVDSSWEERGSP